MSITSTIIGALSPKQAAKLEENARLVDDLRAAEKSAAEIGEKIAAQVSRIDELERASLQVVADGATDIDELRAAEKSAAEIGQKIAAQASRIDELDRASLQVVADGATDIDKLRAAEKSAAEIGQKIAAQASRIDELDRASPQVVADGATDIDELRAAEKSAAEIGEKIAAQASRIDELDRANLQVVADGATAIEIDAALVALDEVRRVLQRLQLQERAAVRYLAEAKRVAHLLAIANARKGIAHKLDKRHALSVDYETKFAELEKVRRALFEANTELKDAWPGGIIPSDCFVEPGELVAAIEAHAYRYVDPFVVSTAPPRMPAPPGARCPRHDWLGQPDKVPNLAAEIERGNVHLLAQLDRVLEDPSAPAAPRDPLDAALAQRCEDGIPIFSLRASTRRE